MFKSDHVRSADASAAARSIVLDGAMMIAVFSLLTIYANWAWFTGDEGMAAYVPPFQSGYNRMEQGHLGAEYFSIASAMYEGRGFSDPFRAQTGPTAWMPPLMVWLLTAMLWIGGGDRDSVSLMFLAMQVLVLAMTATIVLHAARKLKCTWPAVLAIVVVVVPGFRRIFQMTHDCVFLMFWIDVIIVGLWCLPKPPSSVWRIFGWGVLGGLCALASPAVGCAWAVATTGIWLRGGLYSGLRNGQRSGPRENWRSVFIVALTSIFVVAPWVVYQSARLGKFVPVKSNVSFELYQSQVVLPRGIVDRDGFRLHPWKGHSEAFKRYQELGEKRFLEEKKVQARKAVWGEPVMYLEKLANRALAATVWLDTESEADRESLWFGELRVLAVFPFAGLVAMLLSRRSDLPDWAAPAIVCYIIYLAPYVLVSYYERYGIPLALPKMLFTMWLLDLTWRWLRRIYTSQIFAMRPATNAGHESPVDENDPDMPDTPR